MINLKVKWRHPILWKYFKERPLGFYIKVDTKVEMKNQAIFSILQSVSHAWVDLLFTPPTFKPNLLLPFSLTFSVIIFSFSAIFACIIILFICVPICLSLHLPVYLPFYTPLSLLSFYLPYVTSYSLLSFYLPFVTYHSLSISIIPCCNFLLSLRIHHHSLHTSIYLYACLYICLSIYVPSSHLLVY